MVSRNVLTSVLLAGAASLIVGCGQGENDPGPGGVTVGEARALDEAAEMLEERRLPPEDMKAIPSAVPATDQASNAPRP